MQIERDTVGGKKEKETEGGEEALGTHKVTKTRSWKEAQREKRPEQKQSKYCVTCSDILLQQENIMLKQMNKMI